MTRFVARWFCIAAIFTSFSASARDINCQQHQCLAIVDAGSTGSRLHIYAYDRDKTNSPIHITELWSKKISPGFATLEPNQTEVAAYLTQLFSESPIKNIPVYFYATAGMRLLPQGKQQRLYVFLQNWFNEQPQWQLLTAKTITGTEEGLFGWLATAYLLGEFSSTKKTSLGVMDMGGASVQVIFPVQKKQEINSNDLYSLNLYGRHITLFISVMLKKVDFN